MARLPHPDNQSASGYDRIFAMDVVGIGTLNLDYIASSGAVSSLRLGSFQDAIRHLIIDCGIEMEFGIETFIDARTMNKILKMDGLPQLQTALGGSSFNTLCTLGQVRVPLRLGFVGAAGHVPVQGLSVIEEMAALGIDHRYVLLNKKHTCGVCFSFMSEGERTLLTHEGANSLMSEYLESMADSITEYLAAARFVHLSAFPDIKIARPLIKILRDVKRINPITCLTFDPGHVWCAQRHPDIDMLFQLSDYLIVNQREFYGIGDYVYGDSDEDVAARIVQRFVCEQCVIIVKRRTGISSFHSFDGRLVSKFFPQEVLNDSQIQDATGAGDVFAAGLLFILASKAIHIQLGSMLGMQLAKHRMQCVGGHGTRYAEVTQKFIESRASML